MSSIIIDTHILVWYILEPEKLSQKALAALEETTESGYIAYFSSISLVEIFYLVEKKRILPIVINRLLEAINEPLSLLAVASFDINVALAVKEINRELVPEMPDRIIAATALALQMPLITRDLRIKNLTNIQTIW